MSEISTEYHRVLTKRSRQEQERPRPWSEFRRSIRYRWLVPLLLVDWLAEWAAYWLSRLSILELLEYCGSFSILIAVIFYFIDAPQRTKTRHYQAWQVINTAQGKGGSGGRTDALHELNEDHVPLVGVDVSGSFLQGVHLQKAELRRGNFRASDMRGADLTGARLQQSTLASANLRNADLTDADLTEADLTDADLQFASLKNAHLKDAQLDKADLREGDLKLADWKGIASVRLANIHGVRNPPEGFIPWALSQGAVDLASDQQWSAELAKDTK